MGNEKKRLALSGGLQCVSKEVCLYWSCGLSRVSIGEERRGEEGISGKLPAPGWKVEIL